MHAESFRAPGGLAFNVSEMGNHNRVLSRGVTSPSLHFKEIILVAGLRIDCRMEAGMLVTQLLQEVIVTWTREVTVDMLRLARFWVCIEGTAIIITGITCSSISNPILIIIMVIIFHPLPMSLFCVLLSSKLKLKDIKHPF